MSEGMPGAISALGGREEEPREVVDLVNAFMKALKGYRLYLPNNQILQGFVNTFVTGLDACLAERGDLCLRVTQFEMACDGAPVYQNRVKEESLAFRLFINGVRELTFHPGVPHDEVTGFLQVIHRCYDAKTTVDDLLTLLWEKDLQYITFIILDDFFEEGEEGEFEQFMEEGERVDRTAPQMAGTVTPVVDRLMARRSDTGKEPFPDFLELDPEETERLQVWVQEEEDRDLVQDLCGVALDILDTETNEDDTREMLGVLDRLLESLLGEGRIPEAAKVFRSLRRLSERTNSGNVGCMLADTLARLGGRRVVEAVVPHLTGANDADIEAAREFLALLDDTARPALFDLLDDPDMKEMAKDVLREMAGGDMEMLLPALADPRPSVVGAIARLLGETDDIRALTHLRAPLFHTDLMVRRETLRAIERLGTPAALPILSEVLEDNEQEVRVLAVRALATLPPESAREPLINLAKSKEFSRRTWFEKKEIFLALGRVRSSEVADWLIAILRKKPWFRKEERNELRACAALALGQTGSDRARTALRDFADDRSQQVRRVVVQILRDQAEADGDAPAI